MIVVAVISVLAASVRAYRQYIIRDGWEDAGRIA